MQIDSLICLENTKTVPLQKCETRRFSEAGNTNSSTLYIPNSMEGRKLVPEWGINIPCVMCGRLILHKDWRSGFPDILCHRNGGAFACDLLYFQNYFQKWERQPRGKSRTSRIFLSFSVVLTHLSQSQRSMTSINKEKIYFNSYVTLHILKCINIEAIKNYR